MTVTFGVLPPLSKTIHLRDQDAQEKFLGSRTLSDCPLRSKTDQERRSRHFRSTSGGLPSYGVDTDMYRRAASYVDRILRGNNRASFRCRRRQVRGGHQPQTAKTLDLEIPPMLLGRADEVIE
jgi:hypothetical protein